MKCPKCGAPQMFKVDDIDSSKRYREYLWCLSCGLEGMAEEVVALAKSIAERVRRNSSSS